MNSDMLLLLPGGLIWLPMMIWLLRGRQRSAVTRLWVIGWSAAWLSAFFSIVGAQQLDFMVLANGFGTLFAGLILAGTYPFFQQPMPRPLAAMLFMPLVVTSLAQAVSPVGGGFVAALVDGSLVAAAAYRLLRSAPITPAPGPSERLLGPFMVGLAAFEVFEGLSRNMPDRVSWVVVGWLTAGVSVGLLMVLVIGERARARERLQSAELLVERLILAQMTESVPVGLLITDAEARVVRANGRLLELIGSEDSPESWVGRPAKGLMTAALHQLSPQDLSQVDEFTGWVASRRVLGLDSRQVRFKDGSLFELAAYPVKGLDAMPLGRVWVFRDITDEARVAEQIQHAERMETVGTLAGGLAHDFNNQLTAILGNAELLRFNQPLDERGSQMLDDLERAAQHCADLTRGLLSFARREPAEPRALSVDGVIDQVVGIMRSTLGRHVHIDVDLAPDLPAIEADETQFQRVLTNLLVNAGDAVGERGRIRVSVAPAESGIEIVVSDDGPGMDEDSVRRIFDPFFTTKPVGAGTGLGLAVVYGIVEAHQGRIDVESAPGMGATFKIFWPASGAADVAAVAPVLRGRPGPRDACVLLAEDDPAVRRLLGTGLHQAGLRVIPVGTAEEAVAAFDAAPNAIDVAVLDYSMPGGTGLEAIDKLRGRAPGLPVLVVSGHPEGGAGESWPEGIPLMLKPVSPERLAERVLELLEDAGVGAIRGARTP